MFGFTMKSANSRVTVIFTIFVCLTAGALSGSVHADSSANVEALRAQLEEAKKMLEQDSASHQETLDKQSQIEALLEARKAREADIKEEVEQLCETHDKLNPGTFDECMQKLGA